MSKVIKNGKVAVLYSPGWGAGWSTWNTNYSEELIFHEKIVEMVEMGIQHEIDEDWIKLNIGIDNCYTGGAEDLRIEWIPLGTKFTIYDYDGWETILTTNDLQFIA